MSTSTLGSSLGTGGMETKLIAAEIATETGVTTIINNSKNPGIISQIIEYYRSLKSAPTTPNKSENTSPPILLRPPHTVFEPSSAPLRDLKSWTSHTLFPSGTIIIDAGAHHVLSRRESGGRLLPAGVVAVIGAFASGQAVRIVIRRRTDGIQSEEDQEAARVSYLSGMATTRAGTPTLQAAASMTSSIASLDPLSKSMSMASPTTQSKEQETLKMSAEDDHVLVDRVNPDTGGENWEEVEVGRGLANYNSAQIDKLKGLNRCVPLQLNGILFWVLKEDFCLARIYRSCWGMRIQTT